MILTGSEILLGIPIVICYVKFLEQLLLLLEFMAGGENDDQAGVSNKWWDRNDLSMGRLHNQNIYICDFIWICPHPAVEFRNL